FTWTYPTVADTVFKSGDTKTITWLTTGSMANVNLEYSTNNGSSYAAMLDAAELPATNIVNNGTFNWPLPTNVVSKDVFLRVTGTNDDPNSATTTQKIKMAGVLSFVAPVSNDRWGANTTKIIDWNNVGPIANIKVEYSLNGGTDWVSPAIADSEPVANGQKSWLVPSTTSPNAVIRLSDVITDSGTDPVISSVFKVVGSFAFTAPTSSSIWAVTSGEIANPQQNIVWSTIGNVAQVNIRYSATGSAPWTLVTGPINDGGNGGSYAWTVPDAIGTTVKVLVEDAGDPYPFTYNESSTFTIRGDLKVTSPVGGEKWGVAGGVTGAYKTVAWQKNGSIAQFYLDYSKSGATGPWISILNGTGGLEHSGSSLAWNVADDMSNNAYIRLRNVSGPATEHSSPAAFKIMARFDITKPDGGEISAAGTAFNSPNGITWDKWGANATNVKIDLATGVDPNQPCSAVASGSFDKVIIANTPNDRTHPWTPDVSWITPAACVRVYDVNDMDSENRSANPFIIRASFAFIEPTTGTPDLQVAQPFDIIWQRVGNIANVKLEYSPNGNNFTTDIRPIEPTANGIVPNVDAVSGDPTQGRYIWTVPDIEDNKDENIKLRIRDPNDAGAEVISEVFRIIPKFTVTYPSGNSDQNLTDKLKVGHRIGDTATPYTITWTSSSSQTRTPFVVLRYSTDGGGTWPAGKVIANTDNDGSYQWVSGNGGVPDDISAQVKIRAEDASDGIGKDDSNYNIKIISNYKLNSPNGTATYDVGDPLTITWENIGTVANVELAYSTGGASFTSPVVILASTPNSDGSEAWPSGVPDAITSTVRVRVKSTTDDGFDISDTDFRIRGKLVSTAPGAAARLAIGQPYTITWTSYGSIPDVELKYDTNDGKGADGIAGNADDYPNTIIASTAGCSPVPPALSCTASYNWPSVPDTATAFAKIRIKDTRPSESDVIGVTPTFNIVGNFTLLAPNGDEDWRVNTSQTIRFNWGGTMSNVSFHYTKNTAADPATIPAQDWISIGSQNYGAGDGSGNPLPERTLSWTIPDDISPNVRIKVSFADDATVYDVSDDFFKIRGSFQMTSPNGNADIDLAERWITNEPRTITWTTNGTIPNVRLEYSNDNFVSDIQSIAASATNCTPVPPALTCNATYNWIVPDRVLKTVGGTFTVATDLNGLYQGANNIKVRVADVNDTPVNDSSDNNFKLDYYKTTWDVRDLLTNAALSGLTAKAVKDIDPSYVIWNQSGITTNPPAIKYIPYGTWVVTWSKTEYADMSVTVTASQDRDYSVSPLGPLFMQTSTVHIWTAETGIAYDPDADKLTVVGYLMRDGSLVPGPVQAFFKIIDTAVVIDTLGSATAVDPKNAKISASWGTGVIPTIQSGVHEPAAPDATGYFMFTMDSPTGLESGTTYIGQCEMLIGTGGLFKTPRAFSISTEKTLQDLKDTINTQLDTPLSQVKNEVKTELQNLMGLQTGQTVKDVLDEQTGVIQTAIDDFNDTVQSSVSSLESAAAQSLAAGEQLEATAKKFSWKASATPNPALAEDTVTLQAQGIAGLFPVVSIYNHESKQVIASGPMIEDKTNLGNYSFSFKVGQTNFKPGKAYTYIVSEDTTGGLAAGSGFVESTSLSSIAGLAASAPGAERAARQAVDAIKSMEAVMLKGGDIGGVKDSVSDLKTVIDEIPGMIARAMDKPNNPVNQVKRMVEDVRARLQALAGNEGFDFSQIFQMALSESPDIKQIRQNADSINTGVEVMGAIVEAKLGGTDTPIVHVSYTSGSVILRVVAVNPSEEKTQEIPIKIYLPQEATPHDIIDKGDLDVSFDSDKSLYFVFKEKVPLAPKETRVFQVELEDVWFVSDELLDTLRKQTEHIVDRLKETEYFEPAKVVADTIYGRLDQIATSQADESVSKELHIGLYRSHLKIVDQIKEDIARLEKLLVAVGAPPAPEVLAESNLNLKTPSRATTWFIIFAILIFIGLLGAVFFFTWQAQVRLSSHLSSKLKDDVFPELESLERPSQTPIRDKTDAA
ncbi:MAG: hypothetical protein HY584_00155, partial [Candidatus Omnitrophica bacterium]|nr:hypothetical protein [Candidatus Omnitrophota bacterium]